MSFNLAVILSETARSSLDRPVALFTGGQLTYRSGARCRPGRAPTITRSTARNTCSESSGAAFGIKTSGRPAD